MTLSIRGFLRPEIWFLLALPAIPACALDGEPTSDLPGAPAVHGAPGVRPLDPAPLAMTASATAEQPAGDGSVAPEIGAAPGDGASPAATAVPATSDLPGRTSGPAGNPAAPGDGATSGTAAMPDDAAVPEATIPPADATADCEPLEPSQQAALARCANATCHSSLPPERAEALRASLLGCRPGQAPGQTAPPAAGGGTRPQRAPAAGGPASPVALLEWAHSAAHGSGPASPVTAGR
jgi:hypothetical protein